MQNALTGSVVDGIREAAYEVESALRAEASQMQQQETWFNPKMPFTPEQALERAIQATIRFSTQIIMQLSAGEEAGTINLDRMTAALDLALGDLLPFSAPKFQAFCKGEVQDTPTLRVLYQFRIQMVERLQKRFQANLQ